VSKWIIIFLQIAAEAAKVTNTPIDDMFASLSARLVKRIQDHGGKTTWQILEDAGVTHADNVTLYLQNKALLDGEATD